jgi:hypothetical protein
LLGRIERPIFEAIRRSKAISCYRRLFICAGKTGGNAVKLKRGRLVALGSYFLEHIVFDASSSVTGFSA